MSIFDLSTYSEHLTCSMVLIESYKPRDFEEKQEELWPLIFGGAAKKTDSQVRVRIGSENPLESIQGCALVSATYGNGTIPLGSVGVLGPTRMVYENAIVLVKSTADFLSEAMGSY